MFTARIWKTSFKGEDFFHGIVEMPGRKARPVRIFSVSDQPTQNSVCLEVLEWAQRLGKTEVLEWEYLTPPENARNLFQPLSHSMTCQR